MRPHRRSLTRCLTATLALTTAAALTPHAALAAPVRPATIVNAGFEQVAGGDAAGWRSTGTAKAVGLSHPGHSGAAALQQGAGRAYSVTTSQTLNHLADGYYTVTAWTTSSGGQKDAFLAAGPGTSATTRTGIPVSSGWQQVTVRGVHVVHGKLTISVSSTGSGGQWARVDDLSLTRTDQPYTFWQGGDVTELSYVEDSGGVFRNPAGTPTDALKTMADNGVNIVRLRLYNDTGQDHPRIGYPNDYLPDGYQDENDVLDLARRAKSRGIANELTFHYSDYWSNGAIQDIPKDWRAVTGMPNDQAVSTLENDVYTYTRSIMQKMKNQGTTPAFVSLGNEMQAGILFPYGGVDHFDQLARFLKAGYRAVKEVSPSTQVILHLDDAGNDDKYNWFFGECQKYGIPFDVIGASYYPFWTRKDVPTVVGFFNRVHATFAKPIMVMETGFNWNPVTADGVPGQLVDNGPEPYPMTPQGQHDFLVELFAGLKSVDDGAVIGDLYWDPVMIPAPGVGWEVGQPNVVSNSTLFDFSGRALPAFGAYRDNS